MGLVATHDHRPVQLAIAAFPFTASLGVACSIVFKYNKRIRDAVVPRAATRRKVHYFAFSSVLALATLVDMVRIFCRWSFGPSFSMFPAVLVGAFMQYIVIEYLLDWVVPI